MAFVDITTPKSPVAVAVPLLQCHAGKRAFTPEVCQEVLQSTNFAKNIRDMLVMITELPTEKQAVFKGVILSTFDRREQPNDIVILGKKLAVTGGYETKLNRVGKIGDVEGEYLLSGVGKRVGLVIGEFDEESDYSRYEEVFIASDKANLSNYDLSKVKKLRFKDGAKVYLSSAENLPEDLDFSMCDEVDLSFCDLSPIKNLRFKDGVMVDFLYAENLPEDLDLSMCDKVDLYECDLSSVKNLRFKDGARVDLSEARNLPEDLDVSMCDEVDLYKCDLSEVKSIRFKNRAQEELSRVEIPQMMEVTYLYGNGTSLWSKFMGKGGR